MLRRSFFGLGSLSILPSLGWKQKEKECLGDDFEEIWKKIYDIIIINQQYNKLTIFRDKGGFTNTNCVMLNNEFYEITTSNTMQMCKITLYDINKTVVPCDIILCYAFRDICGNKVYNDSSKPNDRFLNDTEVEEIIKRFKQLKGS